MTKDIDFTKFLVMKWEWLENALDEIELETLYSLIAKASNDKPDYKYYVVNTDEPYADKIIQTIQAPPAKISRKELLERLADLQEADPELAHIEADEAIMNYINDKEVEEAFDLLEKWYS